MGDRCAHCAQRGPVGRSRLAARPSSTVQSARWQPSWFGAPEQYPRGQETRRLHSRSSTSSSSRVGPPLERRVARLMLTEGVAGARRRHWRPASGLELGACANRWSARNSIFTHVCQATARAFRFSWRRSLRRSCRVLLECFPAKTQQAHRILGLPSHLAFMTPRAAAGHRAVILGGGNPRGLIEPAKLCQRTRLTPTLWPVSMSSSSKKPSQLRVIRTRGFGSPL